MMTRHNYLKELLQFKKTQSPLTEQEQAHHRWATVHKPLVSPFAYTSTGRYLNHFCVGSDPEFSLVNAAGGRVEAVSLGLKVGLAAGADQNERLIELRPAPSVSVVAHVAGILTALRWMHRVYNRHSADLTWRAGAFFSGDGMGGHIHFGRKRPTRTEEVEALDGLAAALKRCGLFPAREWDRRMQGDERRQHYGLPGDFRIQRHGYEYRSLPSWLQSPTVAFAAIASSKLAVLDPDVTKAWKNHEWDAAQSQDALRGLAKLYKGRDDDAYILYHLLTTKGDTAFAVNWTGDFTSAWGIDRTYVSSEEDRAVILPASIKPTDEEIAEMHDHLLHDSTLTFTLTKPTFVSTIPAGYVWAPMITHPGRRAGFGDFLHNLVTSARFRFGFDFHNHEEFSIQGSIVQYLSKTDVEFLRDFYPGISIMGGSTEDESSYMIVPRSLCATQSIESLRNVLLHTGMFPVWTVDTVTPKSLSEWLANRPAPRKFQSWSVL